MYIQRALYLYSGLDILQKVLYLHLRVQFI